MPDTSDTLQDRGKLIAAYIDAGIALIPLDEGTKRTEVEGWNSPSYAIHTHEQAAERLNGTCNIGAAHAHCTPSPTGAIDIDNMAEARQWLKGRGVDLDALLADPAAVRIDSGREGRAKLIYRLSHAMPTYKVANGGLELRCASKDGKTVQDVLPPSIHPDTGRPYRLIGDIASIPPIPAALLAAWEGVQAERAAQQPELTLDLGRVDQAALAARLAVVQADPDLKLLMEGKPPMWLTDKSRNGFDFALALVLNRLHFTPDESALCISNYEFGKVERHSDEKYIGDILRKVYAPKETAVSDPDSPTIPSWRNLTLEAGRTTKDDLHKVDEPWPHAIYPSRPMGTLSITGGPNGVGKSTEVLSQELHIATGRPYWDMPVTKGRAIFISCEDPRQIIKARIQAWLEAIPEGERPNVERAIKQNFFFFGSDETEGMKLTIKEFTKCEPSRETIELLVALGQGAVSITVETVAMLNGGDEMNTDMMQLALALKEVARRTGASVQAIHHISKEAVGKIPTVYSLRGASSLGDALRGATIMHELSNEQMKALCITRIDSMPVMGLYNVKASYAPCHAPIYIRRVPGPRFIRAEASEAQAKANERARLLKYLQKPENSEGVSLHFLQDNCTQFGLGKREIEGVLFRMEGIGSVERVDSTALGRKGKKHDIWIPKNAN